MTVQEATYYLLQQLRGIYSDSEATNITNMVMEHITGSQKTERMLYKHAKLLVEEEKMLNSIADRLLQHEPVQYVLNEAWFGGFKFYVDNNVLIPRPETDELVEWIISCCRFPVADLRILDIGTGSGCIAVTLKRRLRKAEVWACDLSREALSVAARNAKTMNVDIRFAEFDFLDRNTWEQLPSFDIIVSNPPYIPLKDKPGMHPNVLNYEPHTALFVGDDDPLVFYRSIAEFGKTHLVSGGNVFCEIHEELGKAVAEVFHLSGYATELKKDMQQKDRMIRSGLT